MKKLCAVGEALIDFIPEKQGFALKDVMRFKRVAGGAPANVAAAVAKLGGDSRFVTQLGEDAFGEHIMEVFKKCKIDTDYIARSKEHDTALAFVSLKEDGNRDFMFYRRNSADMMLQPNQLAEGVLDDVQILHYCSVSLVDCPMKDTHRWMIKRMQDLGRWISFDPNVRLSLWNDASACQQTIREFLPFAHIIKISDEELSFISGMEKIEDALDFFFEGSCELLIYTMGKDGARCYRKDRSFIEVSGFKVDVFDTTGAGDSFIGAFLFRLLHDGIVNLNSITDGQLKDMLMFSNAYAALTTTKEGAIDAMADIQQVSAFLQENKSEYDEN